MFAIRTFNVEAGLLTLDEARRLVIEEVKRAKRAATWKWTGRSSIREGYGGEIPLLHPSLTSTTFTLGECESY